jgi:hypothetical protein
LQGSYGNDTNIWGDSDVDIVIMLKSIFRADTSQLTLEQILNYGQAFPNATYQLADFKNGVVSQMRSVFGYLNVHEGNKAIKIDPTANRLGRMSWFVMSIDTTVTIMATFFSLTIKELFSVG